jgi:hypothetical protein
MITIPNDKRELAATLQKQLDQAATLLDQAHATARDFYGIGSAEAREVKAIYGIAFDHAEELAASLYEATRQDLTTNRASPTTSRHA